MSAPSPETIPEPVDSNPRHECYPGLRLLTGETAATPAARAVLVSQGAPALSSAAAGLALAADAITGPDPEAGILYALDALADLHADLVALEAALRHQFA